MYKVSHSNWTLHVNNSCFSRVRPGLLSDAEQNFLFRNAQTFIF